MTIYTAIFGKYDTLKDPTVITKGWEYICYTNRKDLKSNVWKIKYINNKKLSNVKAARCIKIRFFYYVESDLVIWCDASMIINTNLNDFITKHHRGNFTILQHPIRDCIYQEAYACIKLNKDKEGVINSQIIRYVDVSYPEHNGMIQSGLIIRNRDKDTIAFCTEWFREVRQGSFRDQLSFNYTVWSTELIKPYLITSNILHNEFKLQKHTRS